jgi:hypothetical protein
MDLEWQQRQERLLRWQLVLVGIIATAVLAIAQLGGAWLQAQQLVMRQRSSLRLGQLPNLDRPHRADAPPDPRRAAISASSRLRTK